MESPGYKLVRRFGGDVQLGLYMHNKEVLESGGKFVSFKNEQDLERLVLDLHI